MSNITLHQATEQVRELLDQIDAETGEMPEGFDQAREIVASRAVAVTAYIIEKDRHLESIKTYIKELSAKVKTEEARQEYMKRYLREHMAAAGITEVKDERGLFKATLSIGRDEEIEVFDVEQIPPMYLREIPAKTEPNKTLIKKAIKDGHEVAGAKLVKKDRLTIS